MEMKLSYEGAGELAKRSRGTPRVALRLLRRVWDFAQVSGHAEIDVESVHYALTRIDVDHGGLDRLDRALLSTLRDQYHGGPVGIETLAISLGEERATIEDVYEPYLIKEGFIERTSRGRIATEKAYALFDMKK